MKDQEALLANIKSPKLPELEYMLFRQSASEQGKEIGEIFKLRQIINKYHSGQCSRRVRIVPPC